MIWSDAVVLLCNDWIPCVCTEEDDDMFWVVVTYSPQAVIHDIIGVDLLLPSERVKITDDLEEYDLYGWDKTSSASSLIFTVCDIVYEEKISGVKSPNKNDKEFKGKLQVAHQTSHSVADPLAFVMSEPLSDQLSAHSMDESSSGPDEIQTTLLEKRTSVSMPLQIPTILTTVVIDDEQTDILPNPDRSQPIGYEELLSTIETRLHGLQLAKRSVDLVFEFLQFSPWTAP